MCKKIIASLLIAMSLCGCGDTDKCEEAVSTEESLHEISDSVVWDGMTIKAITPVCSFELDGDDLQIFPHYNNTAYINVVKILISDKAFWKTVSTPFIDTDNYIKANGYELITTEDGNTLAYIRSSEEYAYLVSSNKLPSGYVSLVAEVLCKSNT